MNGIFEAILSAILQPVLEFLGHCLLYLVAVPFIFILLTPVVLINACFGGTTYWSNIVSGYNAILTFFISPSP